MRKGNKLAGKNGIEEENRKERQADREANKKDTFPNKKIRQEQNN